MKIKIILAAVGGLIVGVVAMWFLVARTTGEVFADQYLVSVMDQANVALHIRADRQSELLTNIEARLPSYALAIDQEFREHPASISALWMIKAYYERSHLEIPSEIRGIMDSLPPKPPTSCQIRLRAVDSVASTNSADSGGVK